MSLSVGDPEAVADIDGFADPLLLLVFVGDGYAVTLEGAAIRDDASTVDFGSVGFAIRPPPA